MLSPDRWHQIDALFDEALDVAPEARPAFLDDRCPRELRASVDALLRGSTQPGGFGPGEGLRSALAETLLGELDRGEPVAGGPESGGRIDDCRLIRLLGEGGMGEVWEAEQTGPVRRRVALKVVKAGMDTKRVTARFDSERQALALMNHPNVAQVFGGGTAPSGRPYFVMELVLGVNLRQYCRDRDLALTGRLRLFLQICDGVQHAHHKGLVHRDLKPSNILVAERDGQPQPKIIDFGVARALDERHAPGTTLTEQGQIVGTLEYMSPEQADFVAHDVDTRSDVYSLGVILYELLTDALPFTAESLAGRDYVELLRNIRETDPPRPSLRADVSRKRGLRGDLDRIAMKAIEKERSRRYVSAHELAEDVRRHLANRPVLACPPSRAYRMKKLVRRHRATVAGAVVGAIALVAGAAVAVHQAVRATRAERAARADAETAREVSDFLVQLFEVSDPGKAKGETVTARELLDRGAERIHRQLAEQPLVRARVQSVVGNIYRRLGLFDPAQPLLQDSLATRDRLLGTLEPESIRSVHALARLHSERKEDDRAEALLREALDRLARAPRPERSLEAGIRMELGSILRIRARYPEAEALQRQALESLTQVLGADHLEVGRAWHNLGITLYSANRPAEAAEVLHRALDVKRTAGGADHPDLGTTLNCLAAVSKRQGRLEEAMAYAREALALQEKVFGPDHPFVATALVSIGSILGAQGRPGDAQEALARALAIRARVFGAEHGSTAVVLKNVGHMQILQARYPEAQRTLERTLAIEQKTMGPDHPQTAWTHGRLGDLHLRTGALAEAEAAYRRAIASNETLPAASSSDLVANLRGLGSVLTQRGRLGEADAVLARALAQADETAESSLEIAATLAARGALRLRQDRPADARSDLERARDLVDAAHPSQVETLVRLGDAYAVLGTRGAAEETYRQAVAVAEKGYAPEHPERARAEHALAACVARKAARASR